MIRPATIISTRTKDLNERLSKIQYSFDKSIEQCGPKWKESKLAHVLSPFQMTSIDTTECINLSLKGTDGGQSTNSVADRHFYVITICIYQSK